MILFQKWYQQTPVLNDVVAAEADQLKRCHIVRLVFKSKRINIYVPPKPMKLENLQ